MNKKLFSKIATAVITLTFFYFLLSKIGILPKKIYYCNGMLGLDYGAAYDAPFNYFDLKSMATVAKCGGYCMVECTNCPPSTWTCR